MKTKNIHDASHPFRQAAINIIEEVIEPYLSEEYGDDAGVEGTDYYELEDKITDILVRNQGIKTK